MQVRQKLMWISKGGVRLIRLRDNGSGIHPDDLPLALDRHATSKIQVADDLTKSLPWGFAERHYRASVLFPVLHITSAF